jgi:hypothetical protein
MTNPTFSIRGLLGFTTFVAVSCVALMTPSLYWFIPIPFVACVVAVCSARRATQSMWLSALAGMVAYLLMTYLLETMYEKYMSSITFAWARVFPASRGLSSEFFTFLLTLHLVIAIAVSSITAYVAHLIWPPKE